MRFVWRIVWSLWNLTATSAALLPICLSNFKVMRSFKLPISWLRDFTRSYSETSYQILKRCIVTGQDSDSIQIRFRLLTGGWFQLKSTPAVVGFGYRNGRSPPGLHGPQKQRQFYKPCNKTITKLLYHRLPTFLRQRTPIFHNIQIHISWEIIAKLRHLAR